MRGAIISAFWSMLGNHTAAGEISLMWAWPWPAKRLKCSLNMDGSLLAVSQGVSLDEHELAVDLVQVFLREHWRLKHK